jgi:uncharacterized protein YukE
MATYTVHISNVQEIADELAQLGAKVQAMIERLDSECQSSLSEWTSAAKGQYLRYSSQWNNAAADLPIQARNAQAALAEISNGYANAEYQGLGLWEQ